MAVLVAKDVGKAWADRPILTSCDLVVQPQERVGLVGHNGCGKSTLLQILAGRMEADHGTVTHAGSIAVLEQDPAFPQQTVGGVMDAAVAWHRELVHSFELATASGDTDAAAAAQDQLDQRGWQVDHRIDAILDKVGAPPPEARIERLSGGERRRTALAAVLLRAPDLLLLDEPTNHLDAETITWLEAHLQGYRGAVVLVTHDRYLLEAVAGRIVEVERGQCVSYAGSYTDYLILRAERQTQLEDLRARQLRIIAREAAWAARAPAARSSKQRARLDRLDALRDNLPVTDDRTFALDLHTGIPRGVTLMEIRGLGLSFGERTMIADLDLVIRPGERIGIVGPNGSGKTTLLRLLQQQLLPDTGTIQRSSKARLGVLDQARSGLDEDATVFEAAGEGNDRMRVGDRWVFVISWLGHFAFDRTQVQQRVGGLSGGERARLLLAKLMLQGANVLLLDEPTNDLDLATLRVLEEALLAYDGAALIVTHDRAFLDRVCTSILRFEGDGTVMAYANRTQAIQAAPTQPKPVRRKTTTPSRRRPTTKLSFRERQELEALPGQIEEAEEAQAQLEARLADPDTYRDGSDVGALTRDLEAIGPRIEALYERWEALLERSSQ